MFLSSMSYLYPVRAAPVECILKFLWYARLIDVFPFVGEVIDGLPIRLSDVSTIPFFHFAT